MDGIRQGDGLGGHGWEDESSQRLISPVYLGTPSSSSPSVSYGVPRRPVASSIAAGKGQDSANYAAVSPQSSVHGHRLHSSFQDGKNPSDATISSSSSNIKAWSFELIMLLISLLSFATIIIVLSIEDGRRLASWSFYFSLNTVIAALGTLWRAALTFGVGSCLGQQKWNWISARSDEIRTFSQLDAASKGPWGSFMMLTSWRNSISRRVIYYEQMKKIITTDPFFQETVSYTGRMQISSRTGLSSSIGRTDLLDQGQIIYGQGTYSPPTDPSSPYPNTTFWGFSTLANLGLTTAMYLGFDDASQQRPVSSACTTGNCSWPQYTSLAVCSSCRDVSDKIVTWRGEVQDQDDATDNYIDGGYGMPDQFTNYSLPYGHMKYFNVPGHTPDFNYSSGMDVLLTVNSTTNYQQTVAFQEVDTMLVAFLVMRAGPGYLTQKALWNESTPVATECAMSLCINTYNSTLQQGELEEEVVTSWTEREARSFRASDYSGPSSNTGSLEDYLKWDKDRPSLSHQGLYDRLLRSDLQLVLPAAKNAMNGQEARFNVSQATIASLQDSLLNWAVGKIDGNNTVVVYPYFGVGTSNIYPLAEILWNSENLTDTFSTVARSLTNGIRSTNVSYSGDASQYEVYIHIQWPFVILPLIVAVLGSSYVVAIIVQTSRSHLPAWKADIAPVLAYGLPGEAQHALKAAYTADQPKPSWKTVEKMHLGLDARRGLRLRQSAAPVPLVSMRRNSDSGT